MQLTIAAVLALAPLVILPGLFFYYDVTPKIAIALIGIAMAMLLFVRNWSFSGARRLWSDRLGRWFCFLSAAQIISLLVATALSTHPALSWNGGNWRRFGFVSQSALLVFAFIIAASFSAPGLRLLLRATTASGLVVAIYGILQYFGVDPLITVASYSVGEGITAIVRPPSTLGHADYFAGYLLPVIFLGAAFVATEEKLIWKTLGIAAAISGSVAIVLSGTRGAMVALVVGALSVWVLAKRRPGWGTTLIAAGLIATVFVFYFSPAGLKLRARSHWAAEDLRGGARLLLWRDSLRMAAGRWAIGFGPETFGLEFPRYQSVELARAYPDFYHESPHNILVDALVSQGMLGFVTLAGFVLLGLLAARRAAQNNRAGSLLAAALISTVVSCLFVSFTLTGALYFYALVALLVGLPAPAANDTRVTQPYRSGRQAAVLAASAMVGLLFVYFTIRVTVADLALQRAHQDLDAGRMADAITAYRDSQRWHLAGSSDDLYFSRAMAAAVRTTRNRAEALTLSQYAFSIARRAVITSEERQNAWYNLAAFFATANDSSNMERCLRRAMQASPNWFKPHWALAQALQLSGHLAEAEAEAARAADLDGGKHGEVAKFLQSFHLSLAPASAK